MTTLAVDPGVCGMDSTIGITKISRKKFRVDVTTNCEMITRMGDLLGEIDLKDTLKPHIDSNIYQCASRCNVHIACPIPMAILKAIEVEAGLALPRPVTVHFQQS